MILADDATPPAAAVLPRSPAAYTGETHRLVALLALLDAWGGIDNAAKNAFVALVDGEDVYDLPRATRAFRLEAVAGFLEAVKAANADDLLGDALAGDADRLLDVIRPFMAGGAA